MTYPIYFTSIDSRELAIDKESIFYREKYNEILNYIKILLLDLKDSEIIKYFKPKGSLLIHVNPATDVLDFIKLICQNYYLDLIQLNFSEISKTPDKFFNHFNYWLDRLLISLRETEKEVQDRTEKKEQGELSRINRKKLLMIDESLYFDEFLENKGLIQEYIFHNYFSSIPKNLIENDIILIWISYNSSKISELSNKLFHSFDLMIKIPDLTNIERENILRKFLEMNEKIKFDLSSISKMTENWEVFDLLKLLNNALLRYFMNPELNEKSDDITSVIINLIESGEYMPYTPKKKEVEPNQNGDLETEIGGKGNQIQSNLHPIKRLEPYFEQIKGSTPSEFMLGQMYEDAVSKHYNELLIIIDKLGKNEILEKNDRKLLALYPFILNEEPNNAKIHLEKAKKRIDILKQAFNKQL